MLLGGSPSLELSLVHDTYYHLVLSGNTVSVNDWVVLMRDDHVAGSTGCQGSAAIASNRTRNDFVFMSDSHDDPNHDDLGGLVRAADLDNDGSIDKFVDVQLRSTTDGRTAPDPSDPSTLSGTLDASSSFTICLASGPAAPYSAGNPPATDDQFTHLGSVRIYVQHLPPSLPPPPKRKMSSPTAAAPM